MAAFTEKYEFEDEFTEALHMGDMMQFVLASKVRREGGRWRWRERGGALFAA